MPTAPDRTPEQRRAAAAAAVRARTLRAQLRRDLAAGRCSLAEVFARAEGTGEAAAAIGAMRAQTLLESLPGVGARRADAALVAAGVPDGRRVRGLGRAQRAALVARFGVAADAG